MSFLKVTALAIPPLIFVRDKIFQFQIIFGDSMSPTLKSGDIVFVDKNPGNLKIGDVVMFASPIRPQRLVKRITRSRKSGEISMFWVEGDNRDVSVDSAVFGEINAHLIQGRAEAIVFPFSRFRWI